jgi:hypothetical protein
LLLYDIPSCTQTSIEPDTVLQCSCLPSVIGLKDSSGDFQNFCAVKNLLQDRADFSIFIGPEELLGRAIPPSTLIVETRSQFLEGFHALLNESLAFYKERDDAAEEPLILHRRRRRQRPGAAAPFRVRAHNPGIRPEIAGKLGIHGGLDVLRQTTDGASS